MKKKIELAQPLILTELNNSGKKIFTKTELLGLLRKEREKWGLAKYTTGKEFLDYLLDNADMEKIVLEFPSRRETRFLRGRVSDFEVALSLKKSSYLSHYSAVYYHNLTE